MEKKQKNKQTIDLSNYRFHRNHEPAITRAKTLKKTKNEKPLISAIIMAKTPKKQRRTKQTIDFSNYRNLDVTPIVYEIYVFLLFLSFFNVFALVVVLEVWKGLGISGELWETPGCFGSLERLWEAL